VHIQNLESFAAWEGIKFVKKLNWLSADKVGEQLVMSALAESFYVGTFPPVVKSSPIFS
jgi:hypothetical protein